ncbi:Uncharacterised protein [Mycobacterium tuberculosis]|uniref:Uncharacterized protein n=1 Tax=Mycobacterium tuberculosis TaxID=1773 RepID=A0A916LFQ1_MYCTX|nr:Uncharacterised protein [Mycobacterium tuberculosis]
MIARVRRTSQQVDGMGYRDWAGIARLADDADEPVLGDRTGSPSPLDLPGDPRSGALVVDVIAVQQRQ